jgi:glycosyltransferase involved in cell wall biosynthesis
MGLPSGVSVVVPVYRSVDSLTPLCDRLFEALGGRAFEVILVDDGSGRETWTAIRRLAERPMVRGIRLSRNSGQHAALLAGIRAARFDTVVTLDDDLQNPPEEVPRLLAVLAEHDDLDLVYGWAPSRSHRWWRRAGSALLRRAVLRLLGAQGTDRIGPFRAFRTRLRDGFSDSIGPGVSIDALLSWSTARSESIEVAHHERTDGRSGYSLRSLRRFALDVITGYSTVPLRIVTRLGVLSALFGFGVLVYVVGQYLTVGTTVAGFPFLASIIALFSGAQMLSLGIIGEYLGRTHVRVMGRPAYVVAESVGDGSGSPNGDPSP